MTASGIVEYEYSPPREEGWLRHQEISAKPTLSAADGVVAHKPRIGVNADFFLMAAPCRACAGSARGPLQQGGFAAFS